jgi:hypothetical protein
MLGQLITRAISDSVFVDQSSKRTAFFYWTKQRNQLAAFRSPFINLQGM